MQIINIFMGHSAVSAKSLHLMSSRSLAVPTLTLQQIRTYHLLDEFLTHINIINVHLTYFKKHMLKYICFSR